MENLILFVIGFIYGIGGFMTIELTREVKEMKKVFEEILASNTDTDNDTHTYQ